VEGKSEAVINNNQLKKIIIIDVCTAVLITLISGKCIMVVSRNKLTVQTSHLQTSSLRVYIKGTYKTLNRM